MSNLMTLHNEAMDMALLGDKALQSGDTTNAKECYNQAFEKERNVAHMAEESGNPEPGLSTLFLSAASLGYQCGRMREAEILITHALSGNPTNEVASQLRDMLQQIYSSDEFAEQEQASEVSYKLVIPKSETTLFSTIMKRMGWSASTIRKSFGKIAVL